MAKKRYDSKGRLLKTGECEMKPNLYQYRVTDTITHKRIAVYANTLKELRIKEMEISDSMRKGLSLYECQKTVIEQLRLHLSLKDKLAAKTRINVKSLQYILGYSDVTTGLNIYVDNDSELALVDMEKHM